MSRRALGDRLRAFAGRSHEVVLLAAFTGALTGLAVALFDRVVVDGLLDHLFELPPGVLAFMPLCGLTLSWLSLRYVARNDDPAMTDLYLRAFHDPDQPLRLREFPGRVLAAIATPGFGGAMGLEGGSLYMGSTIGSFLQRRFPRLTTGSSRRVLMVAGAAAGVAAIFKAPATGAIFALEVPYQEDLARRMLLPALVSSATGYLTFAAINGTTPLFPVHGAPPITFTDLAGAILLGIATGLVRGVRVARHRGEEPHTASPALAADPRRRPHDREPLRDHLRAHRPAARHRCRVQHHPVGTGAGPRARAPPRGPGGALPGHRLGATVAGGGVGGLFIPLVVAGALLGRAAGIAVGDPHATLFVVIGVAAFLGAGYRVPLAAVMFVAETTGHPGFIVPGLLAAVAAALVMGSASVTTYQRRPSNA